MNTPRAKRHSKSHTLRTDTVTIYLETRDVAEVVLRELVLKQSKLTPRQVVALHSSSRTCAQTSLFSTGPKFQPQSIVSLKMLKLWHTTHAIDASPPHHEEFSLTESTLILPTIVQSRIDTRFPPCDFSDVQRKAAPEIKRTGGRTYLLVVRQQKLANRWFPTKLFHSTSRI